MVWLVTGCQGQLGRSLLGECAKRGIATDGFDIDTVDVADRAQVQERVRASGAEWVFHCAAATKVDRCESESEWASAVNGRAPGFVAEACREVGAGLVHYSTDFVFDGQKGAPYVEDDPVRPLSVYGRTKADGEAAVRQVGLPRQLILRTQWLYGPGGRCFPAAILSKARAGEPLRVVDDQIGCPTMTEDLAAASIELVERCGAGRAPSGTYHAANRGVMTWYDFAVLVLRMAGLGTVEVGRSASSELGLPAPRPAYSVLDTTKLTNALGRPMPTVESGLRRYLEAEGALAPDRREA